MTRGRRRLLVWVLLLVLSTLVRPWWAWEPAPRAGQTVVVLPALRAEPAEDPADAPSFHRVPGREVRLAYADWPADDPGAPVLLLLHGSPVASLGWERIVPELRGRFRLIVPDLPGMGRSSLHVPDYGVAAHAAYARALLDHLGVGRVHVAGYSMGGGVAIALAAAAPERVASLLLVSGLGVQEHELLGDYHLNRALHAAQYAALWALVNLTPHFGLLDWFPLNTAYARNFLDTDQRPLRRALARWAGPALVVHGETDGFVPPEAAREHLRLLPQARAAWFPGGHGLVFGAEAPAVAEAMAAFVVQAEGGAAAVRSAAVPEADPASGRPWAGARARLAFVLLALATLVSEDLACIGGGLLVAHAVLGFGPVVAACWTGIFFGDLGLYALGRWWGSHPGRWRPKEATIRRVQAGFRRWGGAVVLASRFVPGSRVPTYLAAGLLRVPAGSFALWLALAAALWVPVLVGLAVLFGEAARAAAVSWGGRIAGLVGAGLVLLALARLGLPLLSWRGRRLLLGRWRRWTRWEFWPIRVVYPPLIAYAVWLALRFRCLTWITTVNPGMDGAGGLARESKASILRALAGAGDRIARWTLLPAGPLAARIEAARAFVAAGGERWPVVIKPDLGERGRGVVIVREAARLAEAVAAEPADLIVQDYVPGVEFGVFYYRFPGREGEIFAVTEKRMVEVRGDGRRTLEELILADDRAVCLAPMFLERLADRLEEVPAAGAVVPLTELGTHSRGALFLDGGHRITPALRSAVDAVSRTFAGFHFGRYDVRAPSPEAFERGEFTVIELNGFTSEATNVYDPRKRFGEGWALLFRQWRLAAEIAAALRRQGVRPWSVRATLRLWLLGR